MKKILPLKYEKIWGWELWLYSSIEGKETKFESGAPTKQEGPLVKIIYTTQPLSIQVHPDDEWANKLEKQPNGKSESWYILDTNALNTYITLGIKNNDGGQIKRAIEVGKFEDMLNNIKVEKGQFYNIPAGLIHGIGADVVIFEVQQPSELTYRLYDFGRLENGKPRDLHVEKATKVQKALSYDLKPTFKNGLNIFENSVGKQLYGMGMYRSEFKALFVNLETYETFLIDKDEMLQADSYCVIPL